MNVISRVDALIKGLTHFYTGKACRNGHDSGRYTNSGICVTCHNERVKAYNDKFRRPLIRATQAPSNSPRVCRLEVQIPINATSAQREAFGDYVQDLCVQAFFEPLGLRLGPK